MQVDEVNRLLKQYEFDSGLINPEEERYLQSPWNEKVAECNTANELIRVKSAFNKILFARQFTQEESLQKVLKELSDFYDAIFARAVSMVCEHKKISISNSGIAAFALGKLGSSEVNFDSDLDIIFLREKDLSDIEVRLRETIIREINNLFLTETADGHLPRLDFDLRPYGASGLLLPTVDQAQNFYWGSTDLWNRLGWLRGRFLVGDGRVNEALQQWLASYIYPKHLDYRIAEHLVALQRKIRVLKKFDHDEDHWRVKLGSGGIREIEFCVHGQVLLHGGRRKEGRSGNIFEGFNYLRRHELMSPQDINSLERSYHCLRRLEHVSQAFEGRRTYDLKKKYESHPLVSLCCRLSGFDSVQDVFDEVQPVFLKSLGQEQEESLREMTLSPSTEELLKPYLTEKMTQKWTPEARSRWERLLPLLLLIVEEFDDPERLLRIFLTWVEGLKIRGGYFHLLLQNPVLLRKFLRILSLDSQLLTEWLSRPRGFENMLLSQWDGKSSFDLFWKEWKRTLVDQEAQNSLDGTLDLMRECKNTYALEIVHQQLSSPENWRDHQILWNHVPDTIVSEVLKLFWEHQGDTIRKSKDVEMSWVILGSYGGITADLYSDLDCMVIINDEADPLRGDLVRFCQRVLNALSTRTARGIFYPVDWRLSPDSGKGPLLVTQSYFLRYALEKARLWEWLSWFRGREICTVTASGVKVATNHYQGKLLKKLSDSLTKGTKKFSPEDVEQLLGTFSQHRKGAHDPEKWRSCGLIETETLARLRLWESKTKKSFQSSDFEQLCAKMLPKKLALHGRVLLAESWHRRVFGVHSKEADVEPIFDLRKEWLKSKLVSKTKKQRL